MNVRTFDMGVGALTGLPFALTGARVPAASAFLCSRLIWGGRRVYGKSRITKAQRIGTEQRGEEGGYVNEHGLSLRWA